MPKLRILKKLTMGLFKDDYNFFEEVIYKWLWMFLSESLVVYKNTFSWLKIWVLQRAMLYIPKDFIAKDSWITFQPIKVFASRKTSGLVLIFYFWLKCNFDPSIYIFLNF